MTKTHRLELPYITAAQAQKHVTHNEALRTLDALVQACAQDSHRTSAPDDAEAGACHIIAADATGVWSGHDNDIAVWQDGAWAYFTPQAGWALWSLADDSFLIWRDGIWQPLVTRRLDHASAVGINTAASDHNRLSVGSNAALFAAVSSDDGGNGNLQIQLSKQSSGNTASLYFSDNYSGRAEFGLIGSNAFTLKVSPDGSNWVEGFSISPDTGCLSLPGALRLTGLIAPDGLLSDQNDWAPTGLSGGAVIKFWSSGDRSVTGLKSGLDGQIVSLINVGGSRVTLVAENSSSLDANRFALHGSLRIGSNQSVTLRYDAYAARWFCIGGTPGVTTL